MTVRRMVLATLLVQEVEQLVINRSLLIATESEYKNEPAAFDATSFRPFRLRSPSSTSAPWPGGALPLAASAPGQALHAFPKVPPGVAPSPSGEYGL